MSKKLVFDYIDVPYYVNLEWLKKNMENKIDAVLWLDNSFIQYKRYENDAEYSARIHRENHERNIKHEQEYKKYLEMKMRFEPYD